LAEMKWYK